MKELTFEKSFASHPKSIFWSDKNKIQPNKVFKKTQGKYWLNCYECNHSFESYITKNESWCPYCSNNKICTNENCKNCYEKSFASHLKSIFWSNKNKVQPNENTHYKYWFECYECNHSFESSLLNISNGSWCPYCADIKLCTDENCKNCYEKSFASHLKSIFWSNKNKVQPNEVFKKTHDKYWFNCYECNHSFESQLADIVKGHWCSYCTNKKLCNNKKCKNCYEKSFANHPKSIFWSNKNTLQPNEVYKCTKYKYWFECYECNHSFESNITHNKNWCPYCANQKLCNNKNCNVCLEKSFVSNLKSKYWSNKNKLQPRDVFKFSTQKFIFNCDKCSNEFESRLASVSYGQWCPFCKKKTELKLFNWLKEIYPDRIIKTQPKFEWCKNKQCLPFDFLIQEFKIIIELDGPQHFI